jgi:peroxiredoxin
LRRSYPEITAKGADIVVIGTGDAAYAKSFIADEDIPFLVLVDDDAEAARAASIRKVNFLTLMGPRPGGPPARPGATASASTSPASGSPSSAPPS